MKKVMKKIIVGLLSVLVIMPTVAYAANSGFVSCNSTQYTQYGKVSTYMDKNHQPPGGHRYITEYQRFQSNATGTASVTIDGIRYSASTGSNSYAYAVGIASTMTRPHTHSYLEGITSR